MNSTLSISAIVVMVVVALGSVTEAIAKQETLLSSEPQNSCTEAINAAKARLEEGRELSVTVQSWDFSRSYPDHPAGRPDGYKFAMTGNAAPSVMNSPQFVTSIATDIIQACETVSIVQVGVANSGWLGTFGLMEDGSVELFQCQEPGTNISRTWGNIGCT